MDERQIASGIAAPQCGNRFSRHKSVVILAALGCGDPGMAPKYCFLFRLYLWLTWKFQVLFGCLH